jgi:glycolate oxidase iron-sulfur subunit
MAGVLRDNKLQALQAGKPDLIATANIGCLVHMANHADAPVKHWIELLENLLPRGTYDNGQAAPVTGAG